MWLFKKRKEVDSSRQTVTDKVAGKLAGAGIKLQTVFGNKMNKLFQDINQKKLKKGLVVFVLIAGGYSIYLIVEAISKSSQKSSFKIDQIDVPKHFNKTGDEIIAEEALVDEETYNNIQGFKKYMDSLKQFHAKQYDSIRISRPGLLDSVQMLEQIYHSQKVK